MRRSSSSSWSSLDELSEWGSQRLEFPSTPFTAQRKQFANAPRIFFHFTRRRRFFHQHCGYSQIPQSFSGTFFETAGSYPVIIQAVRASHCTIQSCGYQVWWQYRDVLVRQPERNTSVPHTMNKTKIKLLHSYYIVPRRHVKRYYQPNDDLSMYCLFFGATISPLGFLAKRHKRWVNHVVYFGIFKFTELYRNCVFFK